jgi:hypothetical protein
MQKVIRVIIAPFIFLYALFLTIRRACLTRAYFITGTGINSITGERIFFKVTIISPVDSLPIKSIEQKIQKEFALKTAVVLHFVRIKKSMIEYMERDINLERK